MCRGIGESHERDADFILKVITGDYTQNYRYDTDLRISTQFQVTSPEALGNFLTMDEIL